MAARGYFRGHAIVFDEAADAWRFADTGEPTVETHKLRPCGHCGRNDTSEGHDGCLGTLPDGSSGVARRFEARRLFDGFAPSPTAIVG